MKEYDMKRILDSNEYEDLIAPNQLQNPSLWNKAKILLNKIIRGNENHARFSKATPIKYKDENGTNMAYDYSANAGTKTYIDKNGRCIVEHVSPEHFEHTSDGIENSNSRCIREIYNGAGKSGVPKIEEVSWSQKEMPDGTFERVENRVLFNSMTDYIKHQEAIRQYEEIMGEDAAVPADVMNAHVKAKANIRYNENGYDMRLDDFTTRYYHPGDTDFQLKAHTTSHIIKGKDGYTKDVTYRDPENYNKVLGTSKEQNQIYTIDDKHNLTEHGYSFESKDMQIKRFSIDTPQFTQYDKGDNAVRLSDISKMRGEYLEVNGNVLEATGSQTLTVNKNNSQMVTREYSSAQKILEEFKSKHETQELTRINPQTCRLEISNKGKEAVFSMPDEHGYGDSGANIENLKRIFGDVSKSVGLESNCNIYTAGLKSIDGMFFDRSSKMKLNDIHIASLVHFGDSKNTTHNKAIENHKINHLKNHEDLDER